ncbi:MAG: stage II sporulation protein R [Peptococcaceae bacterium]|nr:stage II sporulation protein R [Peptococcaceae bacterium]
MKTRIVLFLIPLLLFAWPKGAAVDGRAPAYRAEQTECIRFHVLAHSDAPEDQSVKRAVRDAILERVAPELARSQSLAESREILQALLTVMAETARQEIVRQGRTDAVRIEYGQFDFPTKSYGTLVLPAGKYEAVRICIGRAEGSNWWCVLFPPLCFVDIEHATAVPVDGKPGMGLHQTEPAPSATEERTHPRVWIWEKIKNH